MNSEPRRARIVVAGTHSGTGKTSIAVALTALLRRRGLVVQTYKVGPDYLDPTHLAAASGRPCFNLDAWMTSREYVRELFCETSAGADICVIEGVMGLFDGAEANGPAGSTAEVAMLLDAPVLLAVDAHGAARSVAAVVEGFANFEHGLRMGAIVANRVGGKAHGELIAEALRGRDLPPLLGAIEHDGLPALPSRHLGLLPASEHPFTSDLLDRLATGLERSLDVSRILSIANAAPAIGARGEWPAPPAESSVARVGIARDEAFLFYYPDNLAALERAGCELVPFSPLRDQELPAGLDALYLGGGYPELHARALAANRPMIEAVRQFVQSGAPVYAECGGLMYLAQHLETADGVSYPFAGVLPCGVRMLPKRKALGYVEITCVEDTFWGGPGTTLRGHEFHYSELIDDPVRTGVWRNVYSARSRRAGRIVPEGLQSGRVLASYIHIHFASNPAALAHLVTTFRKPPAIGAYPSCTSP